MDNFKALTLTPEGDDTYSVALNPEWLAANDITPDTLSFVDISILKMFFSTEAEMDATEEFLAIETRKSAHSLPLGVRCKVRRIFGSDGDVTIFDGKKIALVEIRREDYEEVQNASSF